MGACYGRLGALGEGSHASGGRRTGSGRRRQSRDAGVKTQPLKEELTAWRTEQPITMGQLNSKRDEFWDTAPVFEGRREIWDAIKAAAMAFEAADYVMAQAILDGANIYIPNGTLVEAYDELGNQYNVPLFCLSRPINIVCESLDIATIEELQVEETSAVGRRGEEHCLRIRMSGTGKDVDLLVYVTDTVARCKAKLARKLGTSGRQRWFYGGKLLEDKIKVKELSIPSGHVIQVVQIDFPQQQEPKRIASSSTCSPKRS